MRIFTFNLESEQRKSSRRPLTEQNRTEWLSAIVLSGEFPTRPSPGKKWSTSKSQFPSNRDALRADNSATPTWWWRATQTSSLPKPWNLFGTTRTTTRCSMKGREEGGREDGKIVPVSMCQPGLSLFLWGRNNDKLHQRLCLRRRLRIEERFCCSWLLLLLLPFPLHLRLLFLYYDINDLKKCCKHRRECFDNNFTSELRAIYKVRCAIRREEPASQPAGLFACLLAGLPLFIRAKQRSTIDTTLVWGHIPPCAAATARFLVFLSTCGWIWMGLEWESEKDWNFSLEVKFLFSLLLCVYAVVVLKEGSCRMCCKRLNWAELSKSQLYGFERLSVCVFPRKNGKREKW